MQLHLYLLLLVSLISLAPAVQSQDYPSKPVRLIVASPPGGGTDIIGRLIAAKLQARWGQPVIVENRGGSASNIGADAVAKSAPDGYTLLVTAQGALVINKSLYSKLAYDPDAFVPVSMLASTPAVLLIHPKVPANNVQELIAHARAHPGKLNYATQGIGTSAHLTSELFNASADVKIVHVPYVGTARALLDLVAGEVSMLFGEIATAGPHIRSGKLRALGVGSEKRSALMPDLPSVAEVLPGFYSVTWWGMVAPPGTPAGTAGFVSAAVADALKQPDVNKRLLDLSIEGAGSTPAELARYMQREREYWGKIIRMSGARAD